MPFCHITKIAHKPVKALYPKESKTIGDHLKKKRLDLNLTQVELAIKFQVDEMTIVNWEKNIRAPRLYLMPKIIQFLGYNPLESNVAKFGEKIKQYRILHGFSFRKMAKEVNIDPDTLARWEKGVSNPKIKLKNRLLSLLDLH